jgi:threonine dehydratase
VSLLFLKIFRYGLFLCQNFQKSGSFKFRAATNAILNLNETDKKSGVITHSSGNFAQALALASKNQNISSHIVMPKNAPKFKKNAVLKTTDNLIECNSIKLSVVLSTAFFLNFGAFLGITICELIF